MLSVFDFSSFYNALLICIMSQLKNEVSSSDFEIEVDDRNGAKLALLRTVDVLRVCFTLVALGAGAAVLGLGADTLAVYHATSVPVGYNLALWPEQFDTRPANALIACGVITLVANGVALAMSKVSAVRMPSCRMKCNILTTK